MASAAALLITGCGGSPQTTPPPQATQASQPTQSASALNAASQASLVVDQQGTRPARTLWSIRIEDTTAKAVAEQLFHADRITLSRKLPTGTYRIIVWSRPCDDTCPTSGEKGLGPLRDVCGGQVTVTTGQQTKATAVLANDGTCTVKLAN
jgi:hypothetical protein